MVATFGDGTEHRVNTVEPTGGAVVGDEEELAATGVVGTGFGHGDRARKVQTPVVRLVGNGPCRFTRTAAGRIGGSLPVAVFVEIGSVTAGAVPVGEIPALDHEIVDDAMENRVVVIPAADKGLEVLNVNRRIVGVQFNHDGS